MKCDWFNNTCYWLTENVTPDRHLLMYRLYVDHEQYIIYLLLMIDYISLITSITSIYFLSVINLLIIQRWLTIYNQCIMDYRSIWNINSTSSPWCWHWLRGLGWCRCSSCGGGGWVVCGWQCWRRGGRRRLCWDCCPPHFLSLCCSGLWGLRS